MPRLRICGAIPQLRLTSHGAVPKSAGGKNLVYASFSYCHFFLYLFDVVYPFFSSLSSIYFIYFISSYFLYSLFLLYFPVNYSFLYKTYLVFSLLFFIVPFQPSSLCFPFAMSILLSASYRLKQQVQLLFPFSYLQASLQLIVLKFLTVRF